jgi:predicted nucleic acid-binding protein
MSSFVVVLDACVLFPAALRDTLLRAASAGLYRMQWTDDILEEVQRNLISDRGIAEEKAQRLMDITRKQFPEALITQHISLIDAMPNNPKDRHVLAAAVACRAQVIVTQNLRHFPQEILNPFEVEAQSPDEFLTHLFHLAPDRIVEIIKEQAGDLRNPPSTVADVLGILAQQAPNFVRLINDQIRQ